MNPQKFHVLCTYFNPARFTRRIELHKAFEQHMTECGLNLWVVEVAQGDMPFVVTEAGNPRHLQLRTNSVLWHKERSLNLLAQRLPHDWEKLAIIDADVEFPNWRGDHSWFLETMRQLELYKVVQLFHNCIDLGPKNEIVQIHKGFAFCYDMGYEFQSKYGPFFHPGYAWAYRRDAWDAMGGLIDWAILGSGDHSMATAFIGRVKDSVHGKMSSPYLDSMINWQNVVEKTVRRDIGFVSNTILHNWHGRKKDRRYQERWAILTDNQFNPLTDIKPDYQGLYQLVDHGDQRSINLRNQVRQYFFSRNENSVDLD